MLGKCFKNAIDLRAMLAVLAWHQQGRAFVPYLCKIIRYVQVELSALFLHASPPLYQKVGEMSIRESLILGFEKPEIFVRVFGQYQKSYLSG
jgi:hypothetical protein